MGHRVNIYLERLQEHMEEREWTAEDKEHFLHMVGHSALLSTQSALSVLEFQQQTDERIAAEKEHDRWAIGREFGEFTPEQFRQTERYQMCEDGEFPEIPAQGCGGGQGKPVIERTDAAQLDQTAPIFVSEQVQRRFEETL